jgi:hemerythrin-like domain-containing protein
MEPPADPAVRLTAFGNQLIQVHLWLREQLELLRDELESAPAGGRQRDLSMHCLAFCAAVGRHHGGEDAVAFPELAERFPELRPVLEELSRDHRLVAEVLRRLEELLGGGLDPERARDARTELDSLAALLETHLTYEERRLAAALNSLRLPDWEASPPGFLLTSPAQMPR